MCHPTQIKKEKRKKKKRGEHKKTTTKSKQTGNDGGASIESWRLHFSLAKEPLL